MAVSAERSSAEKQHHPHTLIVDSRSKITITGIIDVGCFNDQSVELVTDYGSIVIKGRDLHVKKVSVDSGEMSLEGAIDNIEYNQKMIGKRGRSALFTKIFR
jgi:sporulation protein YabP